MIPSRFPLAIRPPTSSPMGIMAMSAPRVNSPMPTISSAAPARNSINGASGMGVIVTHRAITIKVMGSTALSDS